MPAAARRDQTAIDAEAALDGIYVIGAPVSEGTLDRPAPSPPARTSSTSKRDFRSMKADDLDLRPIHHW